MFLLLLPCDVAWEETLRPKWTLNELYTVVQNKNSKKEQKNDGLLSFFTIPITLLYLIILKMHSWKKISIFLFAAELLTTVYPNALWCQFGSLYSCTNWISQWMKNKTFLRSILTIWFLVMPTTAKMLQRTTNVFFIIDGISNSFLLLLCRSVY